VFAVADNISDALGLHIFQESDLKRSKVVNVSTFSNFFTRLFVVLIFVLLLVFLPINYAVVVSVIYGISLLSALSYSIAKEQKTNPYLSILEHVAIAILVIIVSYFLRELTVSVFANFF
jgi:VIT1/CCC1 family predicted Fe2+/Mn2+ transporter